MLTDGEVEFYKAFGFLALRNRLLPEEMAEISRDFDEVMAEDRGGVPFSGEETQSLLSFVERRRSLYKFVEDDRIYKVVEQLLGPDFIWVASDANLYLGDTQWHGGDGNPKPLQHVKIVIYPDPLTSANGCLRVIPGSHIPEYQKGLNILGEQFADPAKRPFGLSGAEVPAYSLNTTPGDIAIISENVWHGAFGSNVVRRQFSLIYYENPKTDEQIQFLRDFHNRTIAMFHPHETFLTNESPRIRGMVQKYVDLGLA